jgi:large subunit ribosomal protein L10
VNKEAKGNKVSELSELLNSSKATFIANYRGMDVEAVNKLRGELRLLGVDYRVAKNTLMRLATKGTCAECLDPLLQGPTAVAFASEDFAAPAKVLAELAKTSKFFELKGGVMDGKFLSADDIKALADLPSQFRRRARSRTPFSGTGSRCNPRAEGGIDAAFR